MVPCTIAEIPENFVKIRPQLFVLFCKQTHATNDVYHRVGSNIVIDIVSIWKSMELG